MRTKLKGSCAYRLICSNGTSSRHARTFASIASRSDVRGVEAGAFGKFARRAREDLDLLPMIYQGRGDFSVNCILLVCPMSRAVLCKQPNEWLEDLNFFWLAPRARKWRSGSFCFFGFFISISHPFGELISSGFLGHLGMVYTMYL